MLLCFLSAHKCCTAGMAGFNNGFIQSMRRKGDCRDNAVAESFFHTLKTQLLDRVRFANSHEAEIILFKYVEVY
jgi:putative transposase